MTLAAASADRRRALGAFGERLAEQHLLAKGYRIRARNVRTRFGEIDIIAERGSTLAFVEMKCRRGAYRGSALESITPAKQRRLVALVDAYGEAHEDLPPEWRIDLVAIDLAPDGRLLSLRHVEGCVEGD